VAEALVQADGLASHLVGVHLDIAAHHLQDARGGPGDGSEALIGRLRAAAARLTRPHQPPASNSRAHRSA